MEAIPLWSVINDPHGSRSAARSPPTTHLIDTASLSVADRGRRAEHWTNSVCIYVLLNVHVHTLCSNKSNFYGRCRFVVSVLCRHVAQVSAGTNTFIFYEAFTERSSSLDGEFKENKTSLLMYRQRNSREIVFRLFYLSVQSSVTEKKLLD